MSEYKNTAMVLKAFCDENRLRIIELLKKGELCGCVLLENLSISQSTLSHHMKILVESSIVSSRKDGKWTQYSLSPTGIDNAKQMIGEITKISDLKKDNCDCNIS